MEMKQFNPDCPELTLVLDNIERLRKAKGLSKNKMAKAGNIPKSSLSNLGKNTPGLINLCKLARGLDVSLAQLFSTADTYPDLTDRQEELFKLYDLMDTGRQQQLLMYARGLAGIMPDS